MSVVESPSSRMGGGGGGGGWVGVYNLYIIEYLRAKCRSSFYAIVNTIADGTPFMKIALWVAMETMHFCIAQTKMFWETVFFAFRGSK